MWPKTLRQWGNIGWLAKEFSMCSNRSWRDRKHAGDQSDAINISHMFPENQKLGESYGIEFTLEQSIAKWWKVNGSLSIFRNWIHQPYLQFWTGQQVERKTSCWQWLPWERCPELLIKKKTISNCQIIFNSQKNQNCPIVQHKQIPPQQNKPFCSGICSTILNGSPSS